MNGFMLIYQKKTRGILNREHRRMKWNVNTTIRSFGLLIAILHLQLMDWNYTHHFRITKHRVYNLNGQ